MVLKGVRGQIIAKHILKPWIKTAKLLLVAFVRVPTVIRFVFKAVRKSPWPLRWRVCLGNGYRAVAAVLTFDEAFGFLKHHLVIDVLPGGLAYVVDKHAIAFHKARNAFR